MNKKLLISPIMAVLLLLLSAVLFPGTARAQTAEETGTGLIASGACGRAQYFYHNSKDDYYYEYEADKSVQYRLYEDGTMVISGRGEMGNFDTTEIEKDWVYNRKELIPWYDYRNKIKKVVVEEGVASIGGAAFYGCRNLSTITLYAEEIKNINKPAFDGIPNGVTMYDPRDCVDMYREQLKKAGIDIGRINIKAMQ